MGNKASSADEQYTQNVQTAEEDTAGAAEAPQQVKMSKPNKSKTLSLNDTNADELKKVGIRAELAEKLAQEGGEGRLKGLSDVVNFLEGAGVAIKLNFDEHFHIEKDSSGALSLQYDDPHKKKKKSFSFRRSFSGRKRKEREEDDPSWIPDEEEQEEEGKRFKFKLPRRRSHSSKSEDDDDAEKPPDDSEKIDINTATEEELEALNGIGPSLAKKIIQYREQHGMFHKLEDLAVVKGISKRSIRKLSSHLMVGEVDESCVKPCSATKLNTVPSDNKLKYGKREVVRIISWNLQCFSNEKAANEGVIEVICRTILENG